ncbi:MAG: type I DNA topoisomerase, partial [Proteobacteria bacterium]|nr:type I DNA topoisomerase [Pseudomonadota bacterium]
MSKDLIIVESPAKVKTISKFLGKDYLVEASVGHVRDLPAKDLGVDEQNGFTPQYQIIEGKEEIVRKLRKAAKAANHVYLAPDPDREGEAIAWHVAALIEDVNTNVSRIQFNEITARAVKEALEHPKPLNSALFDSQQARRVLDRLVGYKISPILWKSVKRGISAGRVQSVALKLVVEREKERRAFVPQEYWLFKADFEGATPPPFKSDLWKVNGKSVKTTPIGSQEAADKIQAELDSATFLVDSVEEKKRKRKPLPPYITSTLQQDANNRLGYSAKRTMSTAQRLYEGVELGPQGLTALITYMRTDSVRIAKEAQDAAKDVILSRYGKDFYPAKPNFYKTKGSAQDAHEAIRPVEVALAPEEIKSYLPKDQFKLYQLIWQRFLASQMAAAEFHDTTVLVSAASTLWRSKGERLLFPGYLAAMDKTEDDKAVDLPKLEAGQPVKVNEMTKEQKFTMPPPRYSEASLVKELEEKGIGRPSTYAAIISTLQDRDYVRLAEKRFEPSELGFVVSDQLSENFTELMDVNFTAGMESQLDQVADGALNWTDLMQQFSASFYPTLDKAKTNMVKAATNTGVNCEECGEPMVIKFSKAGEFLGCSAYPKCKNIKNFKRNDKGEIELVERAAAEDSGIPCEKCGLPLVVKTSRRGEFLGCSGYPDCRNIRNFTRDDEGKIQIVAEAPVEVVGTCPDCSNDLVIKRSRAGSRFIACTNYPACKHTAPLSTGVKCPTEGCTGELVEKGSKSGKLFFSCSNYPDC